MISLVLPKKLEERIKNESKRLEVPEEELVLKAILEFFKESLDPESKVEIHLKLCEKFLKDVEELLARGDFVQASEKAWGASAQIVKAVTAKRGRELKSHGELHKFVSELREEIGDQEIRRLWQVATSLHHNFYENWLPKEIVRESIEDVKKFVEKLRELCRSTTTH